MPMTSSSSIPDDPLFPPLPDLTQPATLDLPPDDLHVMLGQLPTFGTIMYESKTRYWYIKMPAEWQKARDGIVSMVHNVYNIAPWYTESERLCVGWHELVNAVHPQNTAPPVINCVPPPSVVGLHISLTSKDIADPDLPECFQIGRRVEFEFHGVTSLRSVRPIPQNICGQYTDPQGMRYYPTRWIFANIKFKAFNYKPRYPPHISISCIAVQLNVDQVDKLTIQWKQWKESKIVEASSCTKTVDTSSCVSTDSTRNETDSCSKVGGLSTDSKPEHECKCKCTSSNSKANVPKSKIRDLTISEEKSTHGIPHDVDSCDRNNRNSKSSRWTVEFICGLIVLPKCLLLVSIVLMVIILCTNSL